MFEMFEILENRYKLFLVALILIGILLALTNPACADNRYYELNVTDL